MALGHILYAKGINYHCNGIILKQMNYCMFEIIVTFFQVSVEHL